GAGQSVQQPGQEEGVAFGRHAPPHRAGVGRRDGRPGQCGGGVEGGRPGRVRAGECEVVAQQGGGGAGVDERVVVAVQGDVGDGAAAGQRTGSGGQEAGGLGHGADAYGREGGDRGACPGELVLQEPEVETEVVRHRHPASQEVGEAPGDLFEGGRVADV